MNKIKKEDVLKSIKDNKKRNKELSNKVAKIAIEEILLEDNELKKELEKKTRNINEETENEQRYI